MRFTYPTTSTQIIQLRGAISALIVTVVASMQAHAASVSEADVRQCATDLFQRAAGGGCGNFFSLDAVRKVDARESSSDANVIADIDFRVKQRVEGNSPAATQCTGNVWKVEVKNPYPPNTGQWFMYQSQADMAGGYLEPNRGLRVRKNFKFEKWESGWRCAEQSMSPLLLVWNNIQPSPALSNGNSTPAGQGANGSAIANGNSTPAGRGSGGSAIATFNCVRSDNPSVTTTLVVDFTSSTVKSLNGFGGIGTGVGAQITDATISWRNQVIKNYGGGGILNFAGSIDRATRDFTFKANDNSTFIFKCR
jgi:hypothetical protein